MSTIFGWVALGLGLITALCCLFNLSFFLEGPRVRLFTRTIGRTATRILFFLVGAAITAAGIGILAREMTPPEERTIAEACEPSNSGKIFAMRGHFEWRTDSQCSDVVGCRTYFTDGRAAAILNLKEGTSAHRVARRASTPGGEFQLVDGDGTTFTNSQPALVAAQIYRPKPNQPCVLDLRRITSNPAPAREP